MISTWSFGQRGHDAAWPALSAGGSALDAVEAACCALECDPTVDSVGFGGLPDAAGRVSLDGCIMLSPARCGSVCAVRRFMHPVSIARRVMEKTPHIMLAGEGAEAFAEAEGFLHADLLSPEAQDAFAKWQESGGVVDQSRDREEPAAPSPPGLDGASPPERDPLRPGQLHLHPAPEEFDESRWRHHDTIGVLALDAQGTLAGACSTSGTPFKLPGRVGDSPIIGHGLYVHPQHGAAVATGSGELIMRICGCFLIVDLMRRGATPLDAVGIALRRITDDGLPLRPEHQVAFIALRPDGRYATASLRPGYKSSVIDADGSFTIPPHEVMLPEP